MAIFFKDYIKKGQTRYEPKRNLHTELKYFELVPWEPRSADNNPNLIILALAKNSDEHYIAMRDLTTRKEYIEKVILTPSGDNIKIDPIRITDDLEWDSAFEFFSKMGIIQTQNSKWRWAK